MNRIRAANDALWTLVGATFASAEIKRNPAGHTAPKAPAGDLAAYVAMADDLEPDVVGAFAGASFDLYARPLLIFAYVGGSKDARNVAAWASVEALKAAIAVDMTLGGVVEHCQVELPQDVEPDADTWLAGGLEIPIRLLFNAPTQAG